MLISTKAKILICGILPPPNFGHSMLYRSLMESGFVAAFDVEFFNMKFWTYEKHKKVTPEKIFKFFQYYLQFIWLLLTKRPDFVLYAISFDRLPFYKDFVFCMTAKLFSAKVVLHDMGQYLRDLDAGSGPLTKKLLRFMLRNIHGSIVMGEVTRQVYEGFMPLERVVAAPGAVHDTAGLVPYVTQGSSDGRVRVLFFSFMQKTKGIWTALKAMPFVVRENPNVFFSFAGPAEYPEFVEEMNQYIRQQGLEKNFEYLGYVKDDDIRATYYRQCDIYIFPTLRDVFGLVLLHAMAESRPIIASREGAIPEIVDEGRGGFLIPKGDENALAQMILKLASDAPLRAEMGRHNREKFERVFTLDSYAKRMTDAFHKLSGIGGAP